jgi:hypothetical protein
MRLSVSLIAAVSARISRDDHTQSSSFVQQAVVDAAGNVEGMVEANHAGSTRAQLLAQMESRVSSLAQAKLTPEAKSVITDTLLPTVDNEIAGSIMKEFDTTQQLLQDRVAALQSSTSAVVAAKRRADQVDTDLVTCRETQKSKLSDFEQCEASLQAAIANLNQQCEEARTAAEAKKKEKEAAATFDLGSSVCSPESCDVASDPTCGLGDVAASVKGLQAQVKLKADHYNKVVQELAAADGTALEACNAAQRYPIENTCTAQLNSVLQQVQRCSVAHETANLDKCSFGSGLQGKCSDLTGVQELVAKIKASDRSDALSEPDRQHEWQAVQRLKCLLEALRDESDLSEDAAATCAADEARKYPKVFDYKEAEIAELTSAANFACTETKISFSGYSCSVGSKSADFTKSEDKPDVSLVVDTLPFSFCAGEEVNWVKTAGVYSGGYPANANGIGVDSTKRNLDESKLACASNPNCKAVTCASGGTSSCTLRASEQYKASPSKEDSYKMEGSLKPAMKMEPMDDDEDDEEKAPDSAARVAQPTVLPVVSRSVSISSVGASRPVASADAKKLVVPMAVR